MRSGTVQTWGVRIADAAREVADSPPRADLQWRTIGLGLLLVAPFWAAVAAAIWWLR